MNLPTPALVTQRAAQRLPRLPLLLLCAAYVLPGVFGRDPWRNADLNAFSIMLGMAEGRLSWLAPAPLGGMADAALLPHWLGALAIQALGGWLGPALAARLPFALLLAATLALVWYATYYLARTDAAQPVAFAFGGEAEPRDYARALADGALLALIACLGLLQLGHETTPELAQLSEVALLLFALAVATARPLLGRVLAPLALVALASSGAPAIATLMGVVALITSARSRFDGVRALLPWLALGAAASAALAVLLHTWHWRIQAPGSLADLWGMVRLPGWFLWPAWPLALWTLWRWRLHLQSRHIAVPLGCSLVALLAMAAMDANDRVLLLALPGVAVLAAFALPTLDRGTSAAIDWFSVFFFTGAALVGWVVYTSMHWGVPAKPLANIQRLAPGFVPQFSWLALLAAALGTLAWLWLVRWRTARHRDPLWKSLVLPASGVALAWLLSMTLWLPALDYARSLRPLVQQITEVVPAGHCLLAPSLGRTQVAALEVFGRYRVENHAGSRCDAMVMQSRRPGAAPDVDGWRVVATLRRPTDRLEQTWILRREP